MNRVLPVIQTTVIPWAVVLLLCAISLSAFSAPRGTQRNDNVREVFVTVRYDRNTLSEVFHDLESKTNFQFVYDKRDDFLDKQFSYQGTRVSVETVLLKVADDLRLMFRQLNNNIAVKAMPATAPPEKKIEVVIPVKRITGQVRGEDDNDGLPGVNILVKGTTEGTVTDGSGNFTLDVEEGQTLVFSSIGYASQEIVVGAESTINVVMKLDVTALDEVVVVDMGYAKVRKSDLTGSVASMSGEEIAKIPVASAAQAITGRLPGVNVLTTDGSPDAEIVIRVRGGGSITQDNSPLYVVDGFIVSSIRDIPPTDIESINVLKDAAATAIYGAQASNGVIVVTTKRPVQGKTSITYSGFLQYKKLPKDRKYEVLSPYEYVMANYEYAKLRSEADLRNFEKYFGKYDDLELYKNKKPTDWQDELFGDPKLSQYHNISISGGTEMTKMTLSLTNNTDEGLMLNSGYMRNVINFKLEQKISNKLSFEGSARITNTVVDGAGTSGNAQINIKDAVQTRPVNGIADELEIDIDQINSDDDFQSFLLTLVSPAELAEQDWRKRTTNAYVLQSAIRWSILDNLQFKTTLTSSRTFDENLRFYGPLTSESFNNGSSLPLGQKTENNNFSYRWLNSFNYDVQHLGDHSLNLLVGQEVYSSGGKSDFVRAEEFRASITPEELFANMTFGRTDRHETQEKTNVNRFSLFGSARYQYKGKYLATATIRSDASSKFSKENRVGVFPAVALGWQFSKEDFMQNIGLVNEAKLRVSIGETGNDRIDATATQFLFEGSTNRGPGWGNVDNVYYTPSSSVLYNPDLVWETTINRNLGLDFTVWAARIQGSLDVYYNTTRDLLLQSAIPPNTGFNAQWDNIGSTSNRGIELGLNAYVLDRNDFHISANFNIGVNRARIEELDGTTERFFQSSWASTDLNNVNDYYLRVGGTLGDIYGYVTDGYYTEDDFEGYDEAEQAYILKAGVPNSTGVVGNDVIRPGFLKLKDLPTVDTDNDGKPDAGDGVINADDRKVIGNALPKFQGGVGFNASYQGFDLSVFFNFQYGNDVYNTGKIQYNQYRRVTYGNMLNTMNSHNRYTYIDVDGSYTGTPGEVVTDLAQLKEMNAGKKIWSHNSYGVAGAVIHSWAIEDGSFIRLNNLSLGYSLPTDLISKWGMTRCRIYATGSNLHIWTRYSGYDPEVSTTRSSTYSALTPGVDYSSFPRSRSYTFGLDITF